MNTGRCIACRCGPYDYEDERLCVMCWTSPFYTNLRRKKMELLAQKKADGGGLRFDEGKERVDLLPPDALLELGKVYGAGARKYAQRNWERGMPWSKVVGPLMRHLFKWMMGQQIDPEDGQRHIAKVAWNAIALLTYELRGIGVDDRGLPVEEVKP